MGRKARYPGQLEGDENRADSEVMMEIMADNSVVEGAFVRDLHSLAVDKDWVGFEAYVKKLRDEGHSATRVNSMATRAMAFVRV